MQDPLQTHGVSMDRIMCGAKTDGNVKVGWIHQVLLTKCFSDHFCVVP